MTNLRTSLTDPIRFDELPIAAGVLGLTFCPGKHGSSLTGRGWARDLELDLAASRVWGASELVTLMEDEEFALLNVPYFTFRLATIPVHRLPRSRPALPSAQPDRQGGVAPPACWAAAAFGHWADNGCPANHG